MIILRVGGFAFPLLGILFALCFSNEELKAEEPMMLTEQQILSHVIGNTATGTIEGVTWSEFYQRNGTIRGRWGNDPYQGKWTLSGAEMCYDYVGSDSDGCWSMSLEGNEITYYKNGKPDGTGRLLKGNPKDL